VVSRDNQIQSEGSMRSRVQCARVLAFGLNLAYWRVGPRHMHASSGGPATLAREAEYSRWRDLARWAPLGWRQPLLLRALVCFSHVGTGDWVRSLSGEAGTDQGSFKRCHMSATCLPLQALRAHREGDMSARRGTAAAVGAGGRSRAMAAPLGLVSCSNITLGSSSRRSWRCGGSIIQRAGEMRSSTLRSDA